jgi:hypothetical protein
MKIIGLVTTLIALNASAHSYDCTGTDSVSDKAVVMNLNITANLVTVLTPEGDEVEIARTLRADEEKRRYALYRDDDRDGYGGSVKVSVPTSVASAEKAVEKEFTAYFTQEIYSEAGHVGSVKVKATCKKSNPESPLLPDQELLKPIRCQDENGAKATFTPLPAKDKLVKRLKRPVYDVVIDESLSDPYVGAITADDNRIVSYERSTAKMDVLNDWDGNSGVELRLPKGVMTNHPKFEVQTFKAYLKVYYNDIEESVTKTVLSCERG